MDMMIVLMQTDLPEPVVPAMRQWGMAARSVMRGLTAGVFAQEQRDLHLRHRFGGELHEFLEADFLLLRVGDFDAHRVLTRHRRDDADALGFQGTHDVVSQRGDRAHLEARRQRELVHRDDRARVDLDDVGINIEFAKGLLENRSHLADERFLALDVTVFGFFETFPGGAGDIRPVSLGCDRSGAHVARL